MFDSKAIKDTPERSKLYHWWIDTKIADWWYDLTWKFFGKPISHIKKMWGWYWNVFRFDYDFDGHCVFAILEYKLKRVERALLNGCAIHEPKDMKALKLAIKLAGRLKDDKYEERAVDRVDREWGDPKIWFEDCRDKPGYSTFHSTRSKIVTEEDKKAEYAYMRCQYKLAEDRKKKEEHRLYAILHKYLRSWWD